MKKLMLLNAIALLFLCMPVFAQKNNSDSLSLASKIDADQVKLNQLQSELQLRMVSRQEAIDKAKQSASETSNAADMLSNNPKNKKLAKRANKNASEARRDARDVKIETDRINKLNKEIKRTQKRLAKNQSRLSKHVRRANVYAAPADTTQQ